MVPPAFFVAFSKFRMICSPLGGVVPSFSSYLIHWTGPSTSIGFVRRSLSAGPVGNARRSNCLDRHPTMCILGKRVNSG